VPAVPAAAPLTRDLTIDGFGLAAVGVIGLAASLIVVGGNATRVIVPWIIVLLVLGLAQVVIGGGWLRNAIQDAPEAPPDLVIESPGAQTRRAGTPTIVAAVLLLLALVVVAPFAPIVAGLAAGAAATDLRSRQWISADERVQGVTILRETSPLPFATSRKRLWVRPSA
jgi:hypothetical protein